MKHTIFGVVIGLLVFGGSAVAQSASSFQYVLGFNGVNLVKNNGGASISLSLSANPTMTYLGATYSVRDIFGVFAISSAGLLTGTGNDQNSWNFVDNPGNRAPFQVMGWVDNNKSHAVVPGGAAKSFTFASISTDKIEDFGYHIRVFGSLPDGADTLYVRSTPVPEPGAFAAVASGLAGLAVLRRRR